MPSPHHHARGQMGFSTDDDVTAVEEHGRKRLLHCHCECLLLTDFGI